MRQEIVDLIIETANGLGEDEIGSVGELSENSILFGKDGALDSMGLVTLIVAVEQAIEDRFDTTAALADDKAMSQAKSPYRTIASLADYAASQIDVG